MSELGWPTLVQTMSAESAMISRMRPRRSLAPNFCRSLTLPFIGFKLLPSNLLYIIITSRVYDGNYKYMYTHIILGAVCLWCDSLVLLR